jgi:putative transposase
MPRRKQKFLNNEIYHVTIRAIDNNLIFKDIDDYYRGIFSIYEFNNTKPVTIQAKRKARKAFFKKTDRLQESLHYDEPVDKREKMVDVLAFCFMPNHIHLLIKQNKDQGISKFMQKVGIGLGKYINSKLKRKGHVFQDSFNAVRIKDENHFMETASHIFATPVNLIEPGWKELGIQKHSVEEITKFLEDYKWSSYQDYIGIKNFAAVTERDYLLHTMGGEERVKEFVRDWVAQKRELS